MAYRDETTMCYLRQLRVFTHELVNRLYQYVPHKAVAEVSKIGNL